MKKVIMQCLVALVFVTIAVAAEKPLGIKEYSSVDGLATAISSYFPKVQGEVKTVAGDRLTVALGTKDGLQQGVLLTVWRDGSEILHPVTHMVLGRIEEEIGSIEVTVVGETTCVGVMKKKLKEPKEGDKARITPKKIGLALVPLRAEHREIIQGLAERLKENGRFEMLDTEKTTAFLNDRKQRDASLIKEMGRTFKLDVVVTIEIIPTDSKDLVTAGIYYTDDARPLDTIVAMLDLRTKRDALGEVRPFFAPPMDVKYDIMDLPFDAQLFVAADLEGTGALEYIFSDGVKLHVFKQSTSGWHEEWVEPVTYATNERKHLNLDVADINGNGKPELFVTSMLKGTVSSYVIEFRNGAYQRIAAVPGFLRVVANPNKENILIGQAYHPVSFFAGQPKRYAWADGNYVPAEEFPLPKGVELYGFAFASAGETNPLLVSLDDTDHLLVYSNGAVIWKSEETYPSIARTVMKPLTGTDAALSSMSENDRILRKRLRGRVFTLDLNGDGRDEILLPKNSGETFVSRHKAAEFIALGWTGARLEQRWDIQDVSGAVLDYQILRQGAAGTRVLALVMIPGGLFSADRLSLMTYGTK